MNLLGTLRKELDLAFVFIAHDLGVVRHFCDRVAVMYLGKIVEQGDRQQIYTAPQHPYTQALLSAAPDINVVRGVPPKERIRLVGDVPSPVEPAERLPVPHALLEGAGHLRHHGAGAGDGERGRARARAGLPLPGGQDRPHGRGPGLTGRRGKVSRVRDHRGAAAAPPQLREVRM